MTQPTEDHGKNGNALSAQAVYHHGFDVSTSPCNRNVTHIPVLRIYTEKRGTFREATLSIDADVLIW